MTCVVYDGKIFAVDSRTTHSSPRTSECVCTECGERTEVVSEKAEKLHIGTGYTFRGQKVIAMAGAGVVAAIEEMMGVIKKEEDIETAFRYRAMFANSPPIPATLVLVCEKNVFVLNGREKTELSVKAHERNEFVAVGSGEDGARLTNKLLNLDAIACVNMAMAIDKGTGGAIHWVDLSQPIPKKPNKTIPTKPEEMVAKYARSVVAPAPVKKKVTKAGAIER